MKAEAPVHINVVIERVRCRYGVGRAGRRVRDAIILGIDVAVAQRRVAWLDPGANPLRRGMFLGVSTSAAIRPRGPSASGDVRAIEEIAGAEIEAGVLDTVRSLYGASRADAITATALAFGFERVGSLVEARIGEAVDRLLARGALSERVGSLVVSDRSKA